MCRRRHWFKRLRISQKMVASSRTYYSLKDFANSSGHTRQKTHASQAPHLMCQVLPYKLSEHTIPGLLNAVHYWILQIQPTAGPRVAELHRHPRGWLRLELKEGYGTGTEVSWSWPVFLKSGATYITHVSTSLWFVVFWLRFSRLSWKGKRVLKLMVCTPHWPSPGTQGCRARRALRAVQERSGSGNAADNASPAWICSISALHPLTFAT